MVYRQKVDVTCGEGHSVPMPCRGGRSAHCHTICDYTVAAVQLDPTPDNEARLRLHAHRDLKQLVAQGAGDRRAHTDIQCRGIRRSFLTQPGCVNCYGNQDVHVTSDDGTRVSGALSERELHPVWQ
eukprot:2346523-Prymnesium_polylepis.1